MVNHSIDPQFHILRIKTNLKDLFYEFVDLKKLMNQSSTVHVNKKITIFGPKRVKLQKYSQEFGFFALSCFY